MLDTCLCSKTLGLVTDLAHLTCHRGADQYRDVERSAWISTTSVARGHGRRDDPRLAPAELVRQSTPSCGLVESAGNADATIRPCLRRASAPCEGGVADVAAWIVAHRRSATNRSGKLDPPHGQPGRGNTLHWLPGAGKRASDTAPRARFVIRIAQLLASNIATACTEFHSNCSVLL